MAGTVKANVVQLGDSATATQNLVIRTNVDGTFTLARGNAGATTQDILLIDANGNISGGSAAPLGVGQTWQNMTGSRVLTTSYTNSTGRPILVAVSVVAGGVGSISPIPTISGVVQPANLAYSAGAGYVCKDTFLVPAGATYSVGTSGSGTPTLQSWYELR